MRSGAFYSGIMHAVILAVLVFGLPSFNAPLNETVIPVEFVVLEDVDDEAVKKPPTPEPPPEPKAEEKAPEPEPPQQQAKLEPEPAPPEPKPEPEPVQAEPEPEPVAPPAPEVKPEPKKEVAEPPPVPKRRPIVKTEAPTKKDPPKPKPDQLTSILRNVEKLKDHPRPAPKDETAKGPEKGPVQPRVSVFEQNQMVQAIQQQLRACWRLDPGAREAEDLVVEIRVKLNPDGSVRQADVVDVVRMVQDAYFRSAAENAKRAIDVCSPFRLPIKKYDVWRELTLRFNPREMFGT